MSRLCTWAQRVLALRDNKQHVCSHTIKTGEECHIWKERAAIASPQATPHIPPYLDAPVNSIRYDSTRYNAHVFPEHPITKNMYKYPDLVNEYFLTDTFCLQCIKGTNDHAARKNDPYYQPLPENRLGILKMRTFWAQEVAQQLHNQKLNNFWSQCVQTGTLPISRCMSEKERQSIKSNICFNSNAHFTHDPNDDDYDAYNDFRGGFKTLLANAHHVIDLDVHAFTIDEGRAKNTTTKNKNMSFEHPKPERKAVNLYCTAVALTDHCGYIVDIKPYNKGKQVIESLKITDEEGDTDNLVNQLVSQASILKPNNVFVQDSKFNSVYTHETLAPFHECAFIGPISRGRRHLPTGKYDGIPITGLFRTSEWQNRIKHMEKCYIYLFDMSV